MTCIQVKLDEVRCHLHIRRFELWRFRLDDVANGKIVEYVSPTSGLTFEKEHQAAMGIWGFAVFGAAVGSFSKLMRVYRVCQ